MPVRSPVLFPVLPVLPVLPVFYLRLRQKTVTQPFTKSVGKRADELISVSLRNVIKKSTGNNLPRAIHFRKRCTLRMPASATRQELRRCTLAKPRCCKSASRFYSLERTSRLYSQKEGFDL